MPIIVKNPHSVLATLAQRPRDIISIQVPRSSGKNTSGDAWGEVIRLARAQKVPVHEAAPRKERPGNFQQNFKDESGAGGREGTIEATIREKQGISAEELFSGARERKDGKGLWLALDCLTDPHNVGAIFRAAAFFGVQGILLTQERSAPLTSVVYDVSCGGVEHVPFTLQTNLQRGFEIAKDAGLWILGSSEHSKDSIKKIEKDRPWLLVLGNEEKGMRRLTEESCDVLCSIPCQGKVTSLNVSVAAGIMISQLS
ncbi:MAG TPA: 23S rRNA (guanosine(2251)-2'-O)-methyltransferase RlmB [Bdellovibrionales bacterium]|nr:MAG: 23S rRNA (guanosine(2251)-2'-O)-methyltransferase RlmB [Bdellovibrionales bacterium GWB1_52_6]OFZ06175.1 MAG: 23S rRNA (guanosine(2251)-2'-O)-methyltransferase RlmB [Bdellovibrionales bacterium GWA1_52_35]OFZ40167.1 MAG: 23S rRNA (guanosine(2251)-2'-O)-methyltransferase RlmB [Bdellovibrionales bacterium GWC1_52_8]HAR43504.1 23S rRNA (guanosine(2251)-2'-O)-methyltransferase RlmB [Bdellovibrionales bacterium]HCM41183.1 23S rRNA (guanosine(2251)-2'-O)-methyltransferase RlmB [Bdellovibriona